MMMREVNSMEWSEVFHDITTRHDFKAMHDFLEQEYSTQTVYPEREKKHVQGTGR